MSTAMLQEVEQSQKRHSRRFNYALGIAACLIVACVHIVGLDHYPATHPDEGFWASGPRNAALFHEPLMDGRLHPFLSPATYVALRMYFAMVTPNLVSARCFSVIMGLLSCLLAWHIGGICLQRRPWLFALLFSLSTLALTAQRTMLLEAHQIFWLVLAATLWVRGGKYAAAACGGALGVALLVKTNSIFCLPVFACAMLWPGSANSNEGRRLGMRRGWKQLAIFLGVCVVVATGGYLIARALEPTGFFTAFRYELNGDHFPSNETLVRIGRFGLAPRLMARMAMAEFRAEPCLLSLAVISLAWAIAHWRSLGRADRLFSLWLLFGTLFHFVQITITLHYLATLAPAFTYLAARLLNSLMEFRLRAVPWIRPVILAAIPVVCACQVARFGYGILTHNESDYWQTVKYCSVHVPSDAKVMAAPYIDLSLQQKSYDFFRLTQPYDTKEPSRSFDAVVDQYGISFVVVDPEWHSHDLAGAAAFLAKRCTSITSIGRYEVYAIHTSNPKALRQGQ